MSADAYFEGKEDNWKPHILRNPFAQSLIIYLIQYLI